MPISSFIRAPFAELNVKPFQELEKSQIEKLLHLLNEIGFPLKNQGKEELLGAIKERLGISENWDMIDFFGTILFLLKNSDDKNEFFSMTEAILNSTDVDENIQIDVIGFLKSLINLDEYFEAERLKSYYTRANSYYTDLTYACELIGRFKKDFDYSKDKIENYSPELYDAVPIISLKIKYSTKTGSQALFIQADEDDLDRIITRLLAAQKELKHLKSIWSDKKL
jgi:hypothetical protein